MTGNENINLHLICVLCQYCKYIMIRFNIEITKLKKNTFERAIYLLILILRLIYWKKIYFQRLTILSRRVVDLIYPTGP